MSFRDDFFAKASEPMPVEEVETAAGLVVIHCLTAGEKDRYDLAVQKDPGSYRARLVQATARDHDGHLRFREDDVQRLSTMPLPVIEPLVDAAIKVNRMSAKDLEDLRKNSTGQSDDFSSDSASPSDELHESSKERSPAQSCLS